MKLDDIMRLTEFLIYAAALIFVGFRIVFLIKRALLYKRYSKKYCTYFSNSTRKTVYGKVVNKKRIRGSLFVWNVFEITAAFRAEEKVYQFTQLTIDKVLVTDGAVEIEYDAADPSNARILDEAAAGVFAVSSRKSVFEIVFLLALLFMLPTVMTGILGWVEFIIRFIYELAGGYPYNI